MQVLIQVVTTKYSARYGESNVSFFLNNIFRGLCFVFNFSDLNILP